MEKPLDQFHKDKRNRDGRKWQCKPCVRTHMRERGGTPEGKAKTRAYSALRYSTPERAEARRRSNQKSKQRYLATVEGRLARQRYLDTAARRVAQKGAVRRNRYKRRALVALTGHHTQAEWLRVLAAHDGLCAYCETAPATDRDHIVPLSRGGSDLIDNIAPACRPCNSSKNAKPLEVYLAECD